MTNGITNPKTQTPLLVPIAKSSRLSPARLKMTSETIVTG